VDVLYLRADRGATLKRRWKEMGDFKILTLREDGITVFNANAIYRILTSVENGNIYGDESGMRDRIKEALAGDVGHSRVFLAKKGRVGAGVGFFYCDTREYGREFSVRIVAAKGFGTKGVRQEILGDILLHAKETARRKLKRDIILSAECKPGDRATNSLFKNAGFFCRPRAHLKKGKRYNLLDLNDHRILISHESGDQKGAE